MIVDCRLSILDLKGRRNYDKKCCEKIVNSDDLEKQRKKEMRYIKLVIVLLFLSTFLLNFTARAVFCFEVPKRKELELKAKARMKYMTLDLTKMSFTESEKRKIECDFEENYSLDISDYDPITHMAIVNIIAKRFDNMAMIQKWYFDGNIWRDDLDPDIIVDPSMPKCLKEKYK